MWKHEFYKIIAYIDNSKITSQSSFYKVVDDLYNDILHMQLILVSKDRGAAKYSQAHLISFAIAAYCDEHLNFKAIELGYDFEMLQTQLFKTLNAGEIFYEYLEYILTQRSREFLDLYWIYYYLLIHGYKGRYDSNSYFERSLYLRQLKILILDHIPATLIRQKHINTKSQIKRLICASFRCIWILPIFLLLSSYIFINYL